MLETRTAAPMTPSSQPAGLILRAQSLESRFGFNDGDLPAELHGLVPENLDWHLVLVRLVRTYLLPLLDGVEVSEFGTAHNPIRAADEDWEAPEVAVTVPWSQVLAEIEATDPDVALVEEVASEMAGRLVGNLTEAKALRWRERARTALAVFRRHLAADPAKTEASGLNQLAGRINDMARAHGFWDSERNFGEMVALMHSELSEALEEHRSGNPAEYFAFDGTVVERCEDGSGADWIDEGGNTWTGVTPKPEGVAVELADTLIRILDTMADLGVDIDAVVARKMAYNDSRAHKHGKAY